MGPSAAAFTIALTSSTVVSRGASKVRSVAEPVGIGTRMAYPSSSPLSSGSTSATALAAPVAAEILVRGVLQVLVLRVRVDRRHEALDDAEAVVESLRHRRKAVRRAGGVGDDVVDRRIVLVVVDAHDDRD